MLPSGRHFTVDEFRCHDEARTPYPGAWLDRWIDVRDLCDCVRIIHGAALDVVSGYRTPEHNADLIVADMGKGSHGVVSSSKHIEGEAADLRARLAPAASLYSEIIIAYENDVEFTTVDGRKRKLRYLLGGIGVYPHSNWVHVDTAKAPDGHLRRWAGS
jgi:uncharacterized protein YcbK (DUF882 family)